MERREEDKGNNLVGRSGERGVTTIFLVVTLIFVILPLFVLAADMAYIFFVRGQLQNAADGAALAAAAEIEDLNDTAQSEARLAAVQLAANNTVGQEPVRLLSSGANDFGSSNDVIIGNWNKITRTFTPGMRPVNAVRVFARRVSAAGGGIKEDFGLFFGNFIGRNFLQVGALATAYLPSMAEAPIAICTDTCEFSSGKVLYFPTPEITKGKVELPESQLIAWTLLEQKKPTPAGGGQGLINFICRNEVKDACNDIVYSDHGLKEVVLRTLRCVFKDPNFDTDNKTIVNGKVVDWTVIVPVFDKCPPSNQGNDEPYSIKEWAEVTITEIFPKKGGSGSGYCSGNVSCPDYFPLPPETVSGEITGAIRVNRIACEDCSQSTFLSRRARLVE